MVFYRFNALTQALKATPAGLFAVSVSKTASGAPKYVYKPLLSAPRTTAQVKSLLSSDSHGHGHGHDDPGYYVSTKFKGWENWKSWRDVPDDLIPKTSWRDPDNPVYSHPTFIANRKKQIWFQRPCGLPVYLRDGDKDRYMFAVIVLLTAYGVLWGLYEHYNNIYKKYYPDSNLFYFF